VKRRPSREAQREKQAERTREGGGGSGRNKEGGRQKEKGKNCFFFFFSSRFGDEQWGNRDCPSGMAKAFNISPRTAFGITALVTVTPHSPSPSFSAPGPLCLHPESVPLLPHYAAGGPTWLGILGPTTWPTLWGLLWGRGPFPLRQVSRVLSVYTTLYSTVLYSHYFQRLLTSVRSGALSQRQVRPIDLEYGGQRVSQREKGAGPTLHLNVPTGKDSGNCDEMLLSRPTPLCPCFPLPASSPCQAVVTAAVLEFGGAFLVGSHVSHTMQSGIVNAEVFAGRQGTLFTGMLASLAASGTWLQVLQLFLRL